MTEYQKALESAEYIKSKLTIIPDIAVVLGSGIGRLADETEFMVPIDYKDIPHFPLTSVVGHKGRFISGKLSIRDENGKAKDTDVLLALGRVHLYEGFKPAEVVFYVKVFKLLGIKYLILTNAAGGVNTEFNAGDIMLIKDHIGLFAKSPLAGVNEEEFGARFPDMSAIYDSELACMATAAAKECGILLRKGVYAYAQGPMFETPAEVRAMRVLGADAIGMSTVPEAIVANYCGIRVIGFSMISNMAAGILDQPLTHEEVIETGRATGDKFMKLIKGVIRRI